MTFEKIEKNKAYKKNGVSKGVGRGVGYFTRSVSAGLLPFVLFLMVTGCSKKKEPEPETTKPEGSGLSAIPPEPVPSFDADQAFADIKKQVAFGPRVPNSTAHEQEVRWLYSELEPCTPNVEVQTFTDTGYAAGETLRLTNLIASFNPTATWRILIVTHFDSRPWADEDPDPKNRDKPVPAANDGGSGTAVMLELARQMKDHPPPIGVDLFFNDGEDYGKDKIDQLEHYFLGVKYFVKSKPADYNPRFSILLDMVGDTNADFVPESNSMRSAAMYVNEIWNTAKSLGSSHFHTGRQTNIEDDHLPLIQAGIPSVDIIDGDLVGAQTSDPNRKYWHTIDDLPKHCSTQTLGDIGKLLLNLIYQRLPQDIPSL